MDSEWALKREERYQRWLSAPGVVFSSREAEKSYRERVSRVIAAYRVTEPDRVPVVLPTGSTPAYLAGSDLFSVMYDYSKLIDAWLTNTPRDQKMTDDHQMGSPAESVDWPKKSLDYR